MFGISLMTIYASLSFQFIFDSRTFIIKSINIAVPFSFLITFYCAFINAYWMDGRWFIRLINGLSQLIFLISSNKHIHHFLFF